MQDYHAVVIDETGFEFSATVRAESRSAAMDELKEMYPEARGFEDVATTAQRREAEAERYRWLEAELDEGPLRNYD
jgi:hypothetical protein